MKNPFEMRTCIDCTLNESTPVWSYVEPGVLSVMHNLGSYLATHGDKWNQSYADSQLQQAQAAAQAHA